MLPDTANPMTEDWVIVATLIVDSHHRQAWMPKYVVPTLKELNEGFSKRQYHMHWYLSWDSDFDIYGKPTRDSDYSRAT